MPPDSATVRAAGRLVGLRKDFGPTTALVDVTAVLPEGQILGLMGPDGAGKTTLIRLLAGLMEPTAGKIEVLGRSPRAEGGTTQAEIGYMPQRFGLYEDLTVMDNLTCMPTCERWSRKRAGKDLRSCSPSPT